MGWLTLLQRKSSVKLTRNQRTVRTVLQVVLAVLTVIPAFVEHLPAGLIAPQIVVMAGLACHYFRVVERIPGFPDWLKVEN